MITVIIWQKSVGAVCCGEKQQVLLSSVFLWFHSYLHVFFLLLLKSFPCLPLLPPLLPFIFLACSSLGLTLCCLPFSSIFSSFPSSLFLLCSMEILCCTSVSNSGLPRSILVPVHFSLLSLFFSLSLTLPCACLLYSPHWVLLQFGV